jgi:hypothetical protein
VETEIRTKIQQMSVATFDVQIPFPCIVFLLSREEASLNK